MAVRPSSLLQYGIARQVLIDWSQYDSVEHPALPPAVLRANHSFLVLYILPFVIDDGIDANGKASSHKPQVDRVRSISFSSLHLNLHLL